MTPDITLQKIEELYKKTTLLHEEAHIGDHLSDFTYALTSLESLHNAVNAKTPIFGYESWHPLHEERHLGSASEMLLRLKDTKGNDLAPYPAIMTFYDAGLAEDIDLILFICALWQFKQSAENKVSINISGRSLLSSEFIKTVLSALESMRLEKKLDEGVIIEIHESAPTLTMSKHILNMFHRFGAEFAIDDVGLSLGDVFRFSEFDDIASYVKIDRKLVCVPYGTSESLASVISFIRSVLPDACLIAEGVKSIQHAIMLADQYPEIDYVQGMHLPDRAKFQTLWKEHQAMRNVPTQRDGKAG